VELIAAAALISALRMVPSKMFVEVIVPVAIFVPTMAAAALISALTIPPVRVSLEYAMAAAALTSALTTLPLVLRR
jgi:hypothetical protein